MQKVYLISEADHSKGLGHIMRLNALGNHFYDKQISFLIKNKKNLDPKIVNFPVYDFKKKKNELLSKTDSMFILDVAQIKNDFKIFFNKITNKNIKIIIYNQEIRSINYDYLIIPYIQKKKYKSSRVIEGNKAIIINYKLKNSFILKKKFFIFINMGATDNNNFTYQVLKKLTNFYNNKLFQINVVVGPFFKKIQIKKIIKITRAVNNINLLNDQENYIKNMQKSSLAIINSGNVKYEIAHLGIPFILIANDKFSLKYCKIFKKTIYCKSFNNFKMPSEKSIFNYITIVYKNYKYYLKKFKTNSKKITDEKIKNLFNKILKQKKSKLN